MNKAIYAGSFDPLHQGHIAIIKKATQLFDVLYVVVAINPEKKSAPLPQRLIAVKKQLQSYKNVIVISLAQGYLAHLAKKLNVKYLVRSARNEADFTYEQMMAKQNKIFNPKLETVLILPDEINVQVRSSLIKIKSSS